MWKSACALVALLLAGGCGLHRGPGARVPPPPPPQSAIDESLAAFIAAVNARQAVARPAARTDAASVETSDPALADALAAAAISQRAEDERAVAAEYGRRGILDAAFAHYERAVRLDNRDATSLDAMARIWRDWGMPHLALAHASRAVYFAPQSPAARNTLGTVLQALGRRQEARQQFEEALRLDNTAGYALTNLCRSLLGESPRVPGADACHGALVVAPAFLAGEGAAADSGFAEADTWVVGHFEIGVRWLLMRRFELAAQSFATVASLPPVTVRLEAAAAQRSAQPRGTRGAFQ